MTSHKEQGPIQLANNNFPSPHWQYFSLAAIPHNFMIEIPMTKNNSNPDIDKSAIFKADAIDGSQQFSLCQSSNSFSIEHLRNALTKPTQLYTT